MNETYYIGAYWGPRRESTEACAQRLQDLLHRLEQMDPLFMRWFKHARSLKESLKRPLGPDLEELENYIRRGVLRSTGGQPMKDAGYHVFLWNGESGGGDVWLKTYCSEISPYLDNSCLLEAPYTGPVSERVLTATFQAEALRAIANAWEPDWGVAMSHSHRDMIGAKCPNVLVGWVTYLSRRLGRVPPLPAPVRIEPVEELGALVILTPERFTASNPEHVALAERVRELLERAGLLRGA